MTLLLSSKFCESQDSILGLTICKTLARQGHIMYVTTTSTGAELQNEFGNADKISCETERGSILLFQPEHEKKEEPNPEWITTSLHRKYFNYLRDLDDIRLIVGIIPETAQTAAELKEELKKPKLVLVSSRIMESAEMETLSQFIRKVDEFWSIGPNVHSYFKIILENFNPALGNKHKEILLEPCKRNTPGEDKPSDLQNNNLTQKNFLVVCEKLNYTNQCNESIQSNENGFQSLRSALGQINSEQRTGEEIHWKVHSMINDQKPTETRIEEDDLLTQSIFPSSQELFSNNYSAIIFPEIQDKTFNFLAMNAVWLGIPTLVSSESNMGKLLLTLPCPEKARAIVSLTGHPSADIENWRRKIFEEILDEDGRPMVWAKRLSESFQEKWENYLPVVDASPDCSSVDVEKGKKTDLTEDSDTLQILEESRFILKDLHNQMPSLPVLEIYLNCERHTIIYMLSARKGNLLFS